MPFPCYKQRRIMYTTREKEGLGDVIKNFTFRLCNRLSLFTVCPTTFENPQLLMYNNGMFLSDARSECQGASCGCLDGYERKGRSCFPINPCHARDRGGCDADAECIYTGPGTHVCLCPPGSRLAKDGVMCVECPDKNCYTNCEIVNDREFIRAIQRQQNRVVLRFLHMVTSDLSVYIGDDSTEIVIYAQEIRISGTLTLPTGLKIAIFARRVIKENGASIELTTDNSARTSVVNVENGKLLCRNTFPGPEADPVVIKGATLNIYTGKSSIPFTC